MLRSVFHAARVLVFNRDASGLLGLSGLAVLLLLGVGGTLDAHAQVDKEKLRQKRNQAGVRVQARRSQPALSVLDANNITLWLRRNGKFDDVDPFSGTNDAFPKGAQSSTAFTQGLLWGGQVSDGTDRATVRVNGSNYQSSGLAPGGLNPDGTPQDASNRDRFHVWRVHRHWTSSEVLRKAAAYLDGIEPSAVSENRIADVRNQYEYDWNNWPAADGAPYEECNGQPGYQPANPDAVRQGTACGKLDGDVPGRPGADQTIWIVTNDVGSKSEEDASRSGYGSPAIGMEVQFTLWAYDRPAADPLGNVSFIQGRLIYTGTPETSSDARIDSMFVSWWADADIGSPGNDFVGVDTSSSLGFAYNGAASDGEFGGEGLAPAAGGWDLLRGPVNAQGDPLGLSSFVYTPNVNLSFPSRHSPGDYLGTLQWYNLMRGVRARPSYPQKDPFVNFLTDEETALTVPGDPVADEGWVDGIVFPPSDRELASSAGPFTMEKGDTVDVVVGKIGAIGSDRLGSITKLRSFDEVVEYAFDAPISLPTDLSARMSSTSTLKLNWAGVEDVDLDRYRIYRSTEPIAGRLSDLNPIDSVAGTSYTDDGELEFSETYHYRVTAVGESGKESVFSNEATAIIPADQVSPEEATLTVYPNPVHQEGTIEYVLPETQETTLIIYDMLGRKVVTLVQGEKKAGLHRERLGGEQLGSGLYFGRLQTGNQTLTQKITIVH